MGRFTAEILQNAEKINQLKAHLDEAYRMRHKSKQMRREWEKASAEFHTKYISLAFPGGYERAYERVVEGDPDAMEAAICFLECRPYYFRSGYMWQDLLRKVKRPPLNANQRQRLERVVAAYEAYKASKNTKSDQ